MRGSEERGLEVFNEALGLLGTDAAGRPDRGLRRLLCSSRTATSAGTSPSRGSVEQINALRADDEFRRSSIDASLIVEDLRHIEGFTNEGVAREMSMYQEAIANVPQRA